MCRFIETIRLEDGKFGSLSYHQTRMSRAMDEFYKDFPKIDLKEILSFCPMPTIGLHKVRLIYDNEIQSIQISHYNIREIKKLKIISDDSISYLHKFENRNELNNLFAQRKDADDVIIVRGNKITDASFANLVFKRNGKWFTPASYLLDGTMRQQLLDEQIIFEEEILANDLSKYEKVKLINAMLKFDAPEIDVSQIVD